MLKDRVAYYYDQCDTNCAETVLKCANDEWNFDLDAKSFKAIACLGAGACCGKFCGAIAGGLAALGEKYIDVCFHKTEGLKDLGKRFVLECEAKLGSVDCDVVRPKYRTEDKRCRETIEIVAQILQSIVNETDGDKAE